MTTTPVPDTRTPEQKQRSERLRRLVARQQREQLERREDLARQDRDERFRRARDDEDHGASGQAAVARETTIEDADGEWRGSANRGAPARQRRRVVCECILDRLFVRANGVMTEPQYRAGLLFRRHWLKSRWSPRVSRDYAHQQVPKWDSAVINEAEAQYDARTEITRALAVMTPAQQRAVIRVCGQDEPVGLAWKSLALGLDKLASHWSVKKPVA